MDVCFREVQLNSKCYLLTLLLWGGRDASLIFSLLLSPSLPQNLLACLSLYLCLCASLPLSLLAGRMGVALCSDSQSHVAQNLLSQQQFWPLEIRNTQLLELLGFRDSGIFFLPICYSLLTLWTSVKIAFCWSESPSGRRICLSFPWLQEDLSHGN